MLVSCKSTIIVNQGGTAGGSFHSSLTDVKSVKGVFYVKKEERNESEPKLGRVQKIHVCG